MRLVDDPVRVTAASAVDELCQHLGRADALATAAENLFDNVLHVEDDEERRRVEHAVHLIAAMIETVRAAMTAGSRLAAQLSKRDIAGSS